MKSRHTYPCQENRNTQEIIGRTDAISHRQGQAVSKAGFPEAESQLHWGELKGIYIDASIKADNRFAVLDLIGDCLEGLSTEETIGFSVVVLLNAEP